MDRHLPTMTVEETFTFAFESMGGASHLSGIGAASGSDLTDDQRALIKWMDKKHMKVCMWALPFQ